jgi:hypothetical protein
MPVVVAAQNILMKKLRLAADSQLDAMAFDKYINYQAI